MYIYKKGNTNGYAMYLEVGDSIDVNKIKLEHWRQSASISNAELNSFDYVDYSTSYREGDLFVTLYELREKSVPQCTQEQRWLLDNVECFDNLFKYLIRSGAVDNGYYFANSTSAKPSSYLTIEQWTDFIQSSKPTCTSASHTCEQCLTVFDDTLDLCPQCHTPKLANISAKPEIAPPAIAPPVAPTPVTKSKYDKTIVGKCGTPVIVDVYRVLDAYGVINPQLQHLVKKGLATGSRGHKSYREDLVDIRESINNAIVAFDQMEKNDE